MSYVFVYTPLKARSWTAMLVGGLPGALPPLMGTTAITGQITGAGVVLFAILFLWQMPHFIAIALFRKEEYAAAGLKSLPLERLYRDSRCGSLMLPWTAELCMDRLGRECLYEAGERDEAIE